MNQDNLSRSQVDELALNLDSLLKIVEKLRLENNALLNQQSALVAERAALIEKTEQARMRIESMISRLRSMEDVS